MQYQHRVKIMPLMSKKILANMVHMQYHLRKYHDATIPKLVNQNEMLTESLC